MKKLTTIIMSLALALGLTACNGNTSSSGTSVASGTTSGTSSTTAPTNAPETAEAPTEPYTSADLNYNDPDSRVSREHDNEALRDVSLTTTEVDGWEDYDTVFIGYPIWWGIAAWPVNGFVKANDFTGKTVIPFATSASSGMGQSGTILSELAGTGNWQDGQRFRSSASDDEVTEWVNSLGI